MMDLRDRTLLHAASTFERYARMHRQKGTQEAEVKALANDEMARTCRAAMLVQPAGEGSQPGVRAAQAQDPLDEGVWG